MSAPPLVEQTHFGQSIFHSFPVSFANQRKKFIFGLLFKKKNQKFKVQPNQEIVDSGPAQCDMTILTPSTSPNSCSSSPSGMVSVHPSPLFVNQHLQHLMHFNGLSNKSNGLNQFASAMEDQPNKASSRASPISSTTVVTASSSSPPVVSPPKPKIGFSIDSIVGTASSSSNNNRPASSSSHSSASDGSRSASPPDVPLLPASNNQRLVHHESGFQSVSPRPGSSGGTPVSVRSEPESSPIVAPPPHPQMMPGWPLPPHQQQQQHAAMGPAYFEALASMRALYAQQQQQQPFHPHMMMAGPPPPPGAGNHPWWLLAQARQQQQRLLAVAAHQRFPAGKNFETKPKQNS